MRKIWRPRPTMAVAAMSVVSMLAAWSAHAGGAGPPASTSAVPQRAEAAFVPGELIVRFRQSVGAARRAAVRADQDARHQQSLPLPGLELVRLAPGESVRAAAAAFERDPDVLYAEPNFYYELGAIPNDPRFPELWGLHNTGQQVNGTTGTADADIDAPEAWDTTTGSSSVVVGVVDSGVAYDHPDLAPNIWSNPGEIAGNGADDDGNGRIDDIRGWDFVDSDNSPRDNNGHGTHVAGTIGARGNDGIGVAGVNWSSSIMPVRVCNAQGQCPSSLIALAFDYAADEGARVVNASLGGPNFSQALLQVVNVASGTLFVVSAGNDSLDLDAPGVDDYPCELPAANVVCVAATDQSDALAWFSNFGATTVDLAAPGTNVLSTLAGPDTVFGEGFEGDIATSWTTGGTNNTWARTNERARRGSFSLADSPGANYANGTDSFARPTNAINLAGRADCTLLYELRLANGPNFNDRLIVGRSTDATNWTTLATRVFATGGDFIPFEDSLSSVSGQSSLSVRFQMISDAADTDDGAHLDDVRVLCPALTYDAGDFAFLDGTSMAAPHVTGTVALMLADTPGASVAELRQRLLANVDTKPSLAGRIVTGGRVNAASAVASAPPAVVATEPATGITRSGATLRGTVNPRGHAVSYRFEYGTTTSYGQSTPIQDAGTGSSVVAVSAPVSALAPNTTYHYRLVATYSGKTVTGADSQFTTPLMPPVVTTQPANPVTDTTAQLNGTVDRRGIDTTYRFEYGLTTSYGLSTPTATADAGSGAQPVAGLVSGLAPDTTYHFRLVATNADGTTVSEDAQFTTGLRPAVTLAPVTAITSRSATLNGTVDPRGRATTYYFEYGLTTFYGSSTLQQDAGDGNGAVEVSAGLSDLAPTTTYHFRLVAMNADGITFSDDGQFTTAALAPPLVTLTPTTAITARGATLNGTVNPRGLATTYHFEYGLTISYGESTPVQNAGTGTSPVAVNAPLTNLTPATTYHFRLVATNADGTTATDHGEFTTAALVPPLVTLTPTTAITARGATLNGTVNPRGKATSYHFEYGTTTSYGTSTTPADAGAGSTAVPVNAALTGLTPATTYHYRLAATNADGTTNSTDGVFTTAALLPPVVTLTPTSAITARGATLNGTVNPRGLATTYRFEYGPTTSYGQITPVQNAGAGTSAVSVNAPLTGLTPATTYHYRLVATNADGTTTSTDAQLTTAALVPPVVTLTPTSAITARGATLNGTVNPRGLATTHHFEYGTTTSYGQSTPVQNAGTGTSAVTVNTALTALTPATTYHYRLVATNADGTTTSTDAQLTTAALLPPVVTLTPTSAITARGATLNGTVNPRGLATTYRFEYGTTTNYGQSTPVQNAGTGNGTVTVNAALTGLTPATTYHYRLVATNADGTTTSTDAQFATAALVPPVLALTPVTAITARGATLNGTVNPGGKATSYHFEYGTTTGYGQSTPVQNAGTGASAVAVNAPLTALTPATTYHYRLVATNADGTTTSTDAQFATAALVPPVVALTPATAITPAGATLNGTVNPRGKATSYHFEYGTTTSYGQSTPVQDAGAGASPVAVSGSLNGLPPATTYHARLVATSADGTTRSVDGVFATLEQPLPPQVGTGSASAISQTAATISATVDPNGQATTYSFEYGRTTAYGARTPNRSAGAGRSPVAVTAALSGLQPRTTYHYRVVASNATGTVAGADRVLTTAAPPPGPPPPPVQPPAPPPPAVEPFRIIAPATLRLDPRGAVTIRLAFPASTPAGDGRVELFRGRPPATAARWRSLALAYADLAQAPKRIAVKSFATKPGETLRLRIRLNRAGRRLVARRRSVKATVRVTLPTQVQTKQVRLRPRAR